jgi:hypothetical protein
VTTVAFDTLAIVLLALIAIQQLASERRDGQGRG